MRRTVCASWCLCLLLPACNSSKPSELPALKIERVRVGIPAGPDSTRSRPGAWCPVYVTLKAGSTPITRDSLRLVVKTNDADDTPFRYTKAVPAMNAEEQATVLTYTRPGTAAGEIDVQVVAADGRVVQSFPLIQRNANRDILEPKEPLLVAVGSRTLRPDPAAQNPEGAEEEEIKSKNLAFLEGVEQMPDQWFGYDAADVVVLATGKSAFITQLLDDTTGRREALVEWVRRGGRLVLSVGKNQQIVSQLLKKTGLLACQLDAPVTWPEMAFLRKWAGAFNSPVLMKQELTVVSPGKGTSVLVDEENNKERTPRPVLLQGSCGLGRVILVAFDVEANPFASWPGRKEFWEKLQKELNVRADVAPKVDPNNPGAQITQQELLNEIQRNLESFQDVPTISFGWVALFTLFYIILVGPLDYFVLKKFFKRMEMTWVTFPATVVLVSATAYFTAYWLKGDDLHIKKLDLVEIDLHDNTACGTTWFALFSPRIQNYTVGVEPVSPEWVAPPPKDCERVVRSWREKPSATPHRAIHSTTVAVLSAPDQGHRAGSATLYPQPYDYTDGATGLEKVPIPVWATRTFTASWTARLPEQTPPIEAALHLPRAGETKLPVGTITNHLHVPLEDVSLFYRDQWYNLGTLVEGESRSVGELFTGGPKASRGEWHTKVDVLRPKVDEAEAETRRRRRRRADDFVSNDIDPSYNVRPPYQLMKQTLFYTESEERTSWANSGLRLLDQSWRFWRENVDARQNREEVILVARIGPLRGSAEELTRKGVAPSALWLDRLPGTVPQRPKLAGFLTQETYLRVYIPVAREQ